MNVRTRESMCVCESMCESDRVWFVKIVNTFKLYMTVDVRVFACDVLIRVPMSICVCKSLRAHVCKICLRVCMSVHTIFCLCKFMRVVHICVRDIHICAFCCVRASTHASWHS